VEKIFTAGQTTDDIMAHAHCMLGNEGYRHTFIICNIYCFSIATVVTRTRFTVTLHVRCLSCPCPEDILVFELSLGTSETFLHFISAHNITFSLRQVSHCWKFSLYRFGGLQKTKVHTKSYVKLVSVLYNKVSAEIFGYPD
jgi:hypothetical protein